jgi:hypothetical protein
VEISPERQLQKERGGAAFARAAVGDASRRS